MDFDISKHCFPGEVFVSNDMPENNLKFIRKAQKRIAKKIEQTKTAGEHIGVLPENEVTYHIVSNARFDFWDFVPAIIQMSQSKIKHLVCSTWIINRINVQSMLSLFDEGKIEKIDFITGIYFKQRETAVFNTICEGLAERGQRFKALKNHSKFVSMQMGDGNAYTIESSANFTENGNIETHVMTNSVPLFRFHAEWMNELLRK